MPRSEACISKCQLPAVIVYPGRHVVTDVAVVHPLGYRDCPAHEPTPPRRLSVTRAPSTPLSAAATTPSSFLSWSRPAVASIVAPFSCSTSLAGFRTPFSLVAGGRGQAASGLGGHRYSRGQCYDRPRRACGGNAADGVSGRQLETAGWTGDWVVLASWPAALCLAGTTVFLTIPSSFPRFRRRV
jgi:hypothetical protein